MPSSVVILQISFHNWTVEFMDVPSLPRLENTTLKQISWFSVFPHRSTKMFSELRWGAAVVDVSIGGGELIYLVLWRGEIHSVNNIWPVVPVDWGWQNWLVAEARKNYLTLLFFCVMNVMTLSSSIFSILSYPFIYLSNSLKKLCHKVFLSFASLWDEAYLNLFFPTFFFMS